MRHVSLGDAHSFAVTATGALYAWGLDDNGRLGLGNQNTEVHSPQHVAALVGVPVRQVSAGNRFSAVLTEEGDVYTMGDGEDGRLGHGDETTKHLPTPVVALCVADVPALALAQAALKQISDLSSRLPKFIVPAGVDDRAALALRVLAADQPRGRVVEIAAGYDYVLARTASGEIFSWGYGGDTCLGYAIEDPRNQLVPKQIEAEVLAPLA